MFLFLVAVVTTSRLIKVAVLARHGNRAPNPQVPYICPNAKEMIDQFREPVGSKLRAALSHLGMAENLEAGAFLKHTYVGNGKLLEDETYFDDGSTFFLSERMNRNIVSTIALTRGMYPAGTGQKGFEASNPNIVPIITSQPFADTLMNLPRDGPCKSRYNKDRKKWSAMHEASVLSEHGEVIQELSKHCGFDFAKTHKLTKKSLVWSLKATVDLFSFATNEGIDASMGGKIPSDFRQNISSLVKGLVNDQRFGKPHQITYWIGRFLDDAIFQNLRDPDSKKKEVYGVDGVKTSSKFPWIDTPSEWYHQNKFLLFLNHRELLISVLKVFALEKVLEETPPSGSMLLWEVHEDNDGQFIRVLFWKPSQPSFEAKAEKLKSGEPVSDLYSTGHVEEVFPEVCRTKGRCTLSELEAAFKAWVASTGTWDEVCNLRKDETVSAYLAEVESAADDGDDQDGWRAAFEGSLFGLVLQTSSVPVRALWDSPSLAVTMVAGMGLFVCVLTCMALTRMRNAWESQADTWHSRHFSYVNLI